MRLSCSSGSTRQSCCSSGTLLADAQLVVVCQFLPIEAGTQDCVLHATCCQALKSDKVEMATHSIAKLDEIQSQLGSVQTVEENALLYR